MGGASVTWHVFQSALSLQASHGPERRPAAPAGRPPSLTPSSSPSTSSSPHPPPYRAAPSLTGSLDRFWDSTACRVEAGGTLLTHWSAGRPRSHSLTNHLQLRQHQCSREGFCMFSKSLREFSLLRLFSSLATNFSDNEFVAFLRPVLAGRVRASTRG